ncbi:hypothetical protein [uncultured Thalassospira sp.]|uniref:hypothetical protein n=1 Tax=uncultured Thalassospira sp. TaxID=404382 RepID=UPI0030D817E2|tara:strand:- start:8888 stop:9634 length:747 start_codon:yes stop_codon:yes gene_type:complete
MPTEIHRPRNDVAPKRPAFLKFATALATAAILGGCSYTATSDIANPVVRKASWFSYLNADDLRVACSAGEAEGRIRIVYNADYYKDVRTFDITPQTGTDNFMLVSHMFGPLDVSEMNVSVRSPLGAFSGEPARQTLTRQQYLTLTDALQQDGFGTQSREGLRLHSEDYYWVALGCSQKQMTLAAWANGDDDLRDLHFPIVLEKVSGQVDPLPPVPDPDALKVPDPTIGSHRDSQDRNFYRTVRGNTLQ